jgi:hypothetical protein
MREKRDWAVGGGFFRIDFPGMGMVTAEEDGEPDAVMNAKRCIFCYSNCAEAERVAMV